MKFKFNSKAFVAFLIILLTEIFIGLFVRDAIIRPYGGDVLVVVLMYCFFQSFIDAEPYRIIIPVLLFSFVAEFGQYFDSAKLSGYGRNAFLTVVLGNSFSIIDLFAYAFGAAFCFPLSRILVKNR